MSGSASATAPEKVSKKVVFLTLSAATYEAYSREGGLIPGPVRFYDSEDDATMAVTALRAIRATPSCQAEDPSPMNYTTTKGTKSRQQGRKTAKGTDSESECILRMTPKMKRHPDTSHGAAFEDMHLKKDSVMIEVQVDDGEWNALQVSKVSNASQVPDPDLVRLTSPYVHWIWRSRLSPGPFALSRVKTFKGRRSSQPQVQGRNSSLKWH